MKIDRGTHVWWGAFKKGVWNASPFLTLQKQNASWGTVFHFWRENLDNLWAYQKQCKVVFMIIYRPNLNLVETSWWKIWFIILILSSWFNDNILLFELLMARLVPSITRWCLDPLVAWPAPLTPGLDPPLEEEGGNNDSEFKEISNPNSEWSNRPPLTPGLDPSLEDEVRNYENYSIRILKDQALISEF